MAKNPNNNKKTTKKMTATDTEYSRDLAPAAGRLNEAGYGKSMDMELAEVGQSQARNEAEINNTELTTGNTLEMNTNGNNQTPNPNPQNDYEFGNLETKTNPRNQDFEFGDMNQNNQTPAEKSAKSSSKMKNNS